MKRIIAIVLAITMIACMFAGCGKKDDGKVKIAVVLKTLNSEYWGKVKDGCDAAAKDLQSIVRKFKRMGIETIACAIGDDKDKIQKIYKDGFVDISDLSALPKKMTSIVKKRIVR